MRWKLERIEKWPFGYRITDSRTGEVILHQDMVAYSSKDDSHEDALEARHFRGDDRAAARAANEAQLAKLELIVVAVNAYQPDNSTTLLSAVSAKGE